LGGLKGHRRLFATLRADRGGFNPLAALAAQHLAPLGLAGLTPLGFVSEAFVGEEELLTAGEDKL
jgi:hypothetical protein